MTNFIILGASGDLTKKKIIPAIYNLVKNNKIKNYSIIGVSRSKINIIGNAELKKPDKKILNDLKKRTYHFQSDFYSDEFNKLSEFVKKIENKHKTKERIIYLSTLPIHFETIINSLSKNKINGKIVFEKPFGQDLKSAKQINKTINKHFNEKNVYRIDHYLGKDIVQNISILRFTNSFFEPMWNNKNVKSVEITVEEDFGVESRAKFYDKYGAIKDVLQNHLLQLLALFAMEKPKKLTAKYIRDEKVKVLRKSKIVKTKVAQYKGYAKEVGHRSNTETFVSSEIYINNIRWKGVPFYLTTGKNTKERKSRITIEFNKPNCLLFECGFSSNKLIFEIQPHSGFKLLLNAKSPFDNKIIPVSTDFCYQCLFPNSPEAYERLLEDVIKGDNSVFMRNDEIEYQWKIVEQIKKGKLSYYNKKTDISRLKLGGLK